MQVNQGRWPTDQPAGTRTRFNVAFVACHLQQ